MDMGDIADAGNNAFRDFNTEDVPASLAYKPVKSVIRAVFGLIDTVVASLVSRTSDTVLDAGYTAELADDGDSGTSAYTPSPAGGNFRSRGNTGAHTLNAPTATGNYTLSIVYTNKTGAGTINFAGFSVAPSGAIITTTVGHRFVLDITVIGTVKLLHKRAAQ